MRGCLLQLSPGAHLGIMIQESTLPTTPQTPGEIATYDRQTRFLSNFARLGTTLKAAEATGIDRGTVYDWVNGDSYGFRERMANSHADFAEAVEDVVFHDVFGPKPHPILLMFTMKAHNRAKYGDQVVVVNDNASELLAAVRGLPSGGVVEGEVREISGEEEVKRSVGG